MGQWSFQGHNGGGSTQHSLASLIVSGEGGAITAGCAATAPKASGVEQKLHRGAEKRDEVGVGVTAGNIYPFPLVVIVGRESLGSLRWAGEAIVCIDSVFGRKVWRRA